MLNPKGMKKWFFISGAFLFICVAVFMAALSPAVFQDNARQDMSAKRMLLRELMDCLQSYEIRNGYPAPNLEAAFPVGDAKSDLLMRIQKETKNITYLNASGFDPERDIKIIKFKLKNGDVLVAHSNFKITLEKRQP